MEVKYYSSSFLLPKGGGENDRSSPGYALVVLNPRFTPLLWDHARMRVCADGGANRVFDEMPSHEDALDIHARCNKLIKGDMDSIRGDVLDFYAGLGTKVVDESHDQDSTDLHKCIVYIRDYMPISEKENLCILVTGALGGRFDHEAGNINVLYSFSTLRITLLSDDYLIHLLPKNHHHEIYVQHSMEGPHCGLIPIGMPSGSTTTSGLQWDLDESEKVWWSSKYIKHSQNGEGLNLKPSRTRDLGQTLPKFFSNSQRRESDGAIRFRSPLDYFH